MAILTNQGTLLFTPEGGTQSSLASNTTTTDISVTYGLTVTHGATPTTFTVGDTITYTAVLENTGSGSLYNPFVTVGETGGTLTYVPGSVSAFLYTGTETTPVAVSVTSTTPLTFTTGAVMPAGSILYINYQSTVTAATDNAIVSTATGAANEGSDLGPTVSDSDTATITRTLLSIVKTAPETANVGDTINYQFTINNTSAGAITLDGLSDQLPTGFSLGSVTLTVNGTAVPLTEGTDYTVSEAGLFVLDPASAVSVPSGGTAILTLTGVVTA